MKSFAEISDELKRLEALDLRSGDWVWLRAFDDWPRQKARLRGNLAAVMLVEVAPQDATDDGLRIITADKIEGKVL